MNVAGIDPGVNGALAIVNERGVVFVDDLPVYRITSGRAIKSQLDVSSFREMLLAYEIDHVMIEQVAARPGQGVTSMFRFGYAAGAVYGLVTGLMFPTSFVTPQRWQKHAGIGPLPDGARQRAVQLYPGAAASLARKRDAGRADALLIARWGLSCTGVSSSGSSPEVR